MRRIGLGLVVLAASFNLGCRSLDRGPASATRPPETADQGDESPRGLFSKKAVPDSVMMPDSATAGYRDTLTPP